jgi:hypothetical protein
MEQGNPCKAFKLFKIQAGGLDLGAVSQLVAAMATRTEKPTRITEALMNITEINLKLN